MPKVHKPNHLFKIIISYVDSPMYSLASFLHNFIIKGISKAQSYISNSFELVEKLSNFRRVDNDYCFIIGYFVVRKYFKPFISQWSVQKELNLINCDIPKNKFFNAVRLVLDSTYIW